MRSLLAAGSEQSAIKWKRIYDRTGGARMSIAVSMGAAGWMGAIDARVSARLWARLARDTQMHLLEYQLLHQFNLGTDIGKWMNWGSMTR